MKPRKTPEVFGFSSPALKEPTPSSLGQGLDLPVLLRAVATSGRPGDFDALLRTALDGIERLGDAMDRARRYRAIAEPVAEADGLKQVSPDLRLRLLQGLRRIARRETDYRALNWSVEGLLSLREFDAVRAVLSRVSNEDTKAVLEGKLAVALADAGRIQEALTIIDRGQVDGGTARTNQMVDGVYASIAVAEANAADWGRAQTMAQKVSPNFSGRDAMLEGIASRLIAAGKVDSAVVLAGKVGDGRVQAGIYVSVADNLFQSGQLEAARRTLREAASQAATIAGGPPRAQTLGRLAVAQFQRDDRGAAVETARSIAIPRYRAIAFQQIAEQQLQAGNLKGFRAALALAAQAVSEMRSGGEGEQAAQFAQLAQLSHKAGDLVQYRALLAQALDSAGKVEDPFWKLGAYGAVAGAFRLANSMTEWAQMVDRIRTPLDRVIACAVAVMVLRPDVRGQ
jgi:predicted negative regulator of RcsB-dependent stress response